MAKLSVNVNKIATLRNSRGGNNPNLLQVAKDMIAFGAEGITVHPRPDGRHIRQADVYELSKNIDVEFNIEGYPSADFVALIQEISPAQCTLVPDAPDAITSNAGWKVRQNAEFLRDVTSELKKTGCRVSLFFDPYDVHGDDLKFIKDSIGADRIELYTEAYAKAYSTAERDQVLAVYRKAAQQAVQAGLAVNAGHDLDLHNLAYFLRAIPEVEEVSIGHALICDSLYLGLQETIRRYLSAAKAS